MSISFKVGITSTSFFNWDISRAFFLGPRCSAIPLFIQLRSLSGPLGLSFNFASSNSLPIVEPLRSYVWWISLWAGKTTVNSTNGGWYHYWSQQDALYVPSSWLYATHKTAKSKYSGSIWHATINPVHNSQTQINLVRSGAYLKILPEYLPQILMFRMM